MAPEVIAADALELEYEVDEMPDILDDLLGDAKPDDYAGTLPPQQSYADAILKSDLFDFTVSSPRFGCEIYFFYMHPL